MQTTHNSKKTNKRTSVNQGNAVGIRIPTVGFPKIAGAILIGGVATFSIFVLMHHLIANDSIPNVPPEPITFISSIYQEIDEKVYEDKHKIKPPPIVETPPERVRETIPRDEITGVGFDDFVAPKVDPVGTETRFTGFNTAGDARPIVRINPDYPPEAARDGIEGWVELRFSIDQSGAVQNVTVVNSEPKRIFDRAAKRALQRWKYQAKMEAGKAVVQQGLSVMLEFKLSV